MSGPPAISVVIPVRNDPDRLRACLASLLASTHADHEVIVVDDASTDGTAEIAREMGAQVLRLDRQRGPAAARNRGAEVARGEHLFFVDADVCVHPDTLARVASTFAGDPGVDALFGSYDLSPGMPDFLSQYKNLFHHFVHQQGAPEASTFWSGCGAIKRSVFAEAGGFDAARYARPSIEDIELGARLVRRGRRIVLRKDIQVTHLKRWTLPGILKSDVWDRGVPWTELILREGSLPNDLNLRTSQRVSALLAAGLVATVAAGIVGLLGPPVAWPVAAIAILGVLMVINRDFYAFFRRERGVLFAARVVPLHVLYYLYGMTAFVIGAARHSRRRMAMGRRGVKAEAP